MDAFCPKCGQTIPARSLKSYKMDCLKGKCPSCGTKTVFHQNERGEMVPVMIGADHKELDKLNARSAEQRMFAIEDPDGAYHPMTPYGQAAKVSERAGNMAIGQRIRTMEGATVTRLMNEKPKSKTTEYPHCPNCGINLTKGTHRENYMRSDGVMLAMFDCDCGCRSVFETITHDEGDRTVERFARDSYQIVYEHGMKKYDDRPDFQKSFTLYSPTNGDEHIHNQKFGDISQMYPKAGKMRIGQTVKFGQIQLTRVANEKPRLFNLKNKKPLYDENAQGNQFMHVPCKHCHRLNQATDMKTNGYDEQGNLYEVYHCPHCGGWFTLEYDGPTEFCNATYGEE